MLTTLRHLAAKAKPLLAHGIDTLFPARCPACHEPVAKHGSLCGACWQHMHFISEPMCRTCGLPFEFTMSANMLCARCMEHPPSYVEARAIFRYDEHSRPQVMALKYHDKTALAPIFGEWLSRTGAVYANKAQVIIPVPLHYRRLISRRYNQAALIAHALSHHMHLPVLPDTLKRTRATPTQSGLSRKQREENMRGAFAVPPTKRAAIKGVSVILVDDVMTTGATLDACARVLKKAGVRDVYALTLARTVIGS